MKKGKNDTKKYLERAKSRIHSAEVLKKAGQYNDAISRVYYAFFDAATAALITKDLFAKTHHGVIILFEHHFVKTGITSMQTGRWLARALEARQEADYEVYKEFTENQVEAGIKAAKEFVAEIENMLKKKNIKNNTKGRGGKLWPPDSNS